MQWRQWALDHKDFPKFQTNFFDQVYKYNEDIDNKLKDPDFIKKQLHHYLSNEKKKMKILNQNLERF
tara:strand:- start:181 stop:381 length:201 start_codon:yes stop_codon:yes gene_type:complete